MPIAHKYTSRGKRQSLVPVVAVELGEGVASAVGSRGRGYIFNNAAYAQGGHVWPGARRSLRWALKRWLKDVTR